MKNIEYKEIPSSIEEDQNKSRSIWKNGLFIGLDLGKSIELFFGHKREKKLDENGEEKEVTVAFSCKVQKPLTRDRAINAAEMAAYGLFDATDIASLNASLSRKYREDINNQEVIDHDEFIAWVKKELDKIGLINSNPSQKDNSLISRNDLIALSKIMMEEMSISEENAPKVKNFYPIWGEEGAEFGKSVDIGFRLRVVNREIKQNDLFEVISKHSLQADWAPGQGTESLYKRLDEKHKGTLEDPIPWPSDGNMTLELGKYYIDLGVIYQCIEAVGPIYCSLKDAARYVKPIE